MNNQNPNQNPNPNHLTNEEQSSSSSQNNGHINTDLQDDFNSKFNQFVKEASKVEHLDKLVSQLPNHPADATTSDTTDGSVKQHQPEEPSADAELILAAKKTLNPNYTGEKDAHGNDIPKDLFGNYEIVYHDEQKIPDQFTALKEDHPMEATSVPSDAEIKNNALNQAKSETERAEIAALFETNGKEINVSYVRGLIEASLYVLGSEGLNLHDLRRVTELPLPIVKSIIDEMVTYYAKNPNSGLLLVQYGNRYKFVTKAEYNAKVGMVLNRKTKKPLSESAIETLSVIAYNQPCTKGTIEKIRNRDCTNAIQRLLELGLIETEGKSDAIGKPWLYSVSQKFFDVYGIKSLSELPPIDRQSKHYNDQGTELDLTIDDE